MSASYSNETIDNSSLLILIPVFNDWKSLELLLINLDQVLQERNIPADVLVVDDASSMSADKHFIPSKFKAINRIDILELKRNLGHQRAIAVGLSYVEANRNCKAIIVMDGDGEDAPIDVLKLIDKCAIEDYEKVVFARRSQRSESQFFKLFYITYKWLYKLLTGHEIRVGNFSIIPRKALQRLVVVSEIWNHYAAGVLKAKIPYTEVPCKRSTRLHGKSKMNFVLLVNHGLSAISVYGDIVGIRLLVSSCLLILLALISIIAVLAIKLTTSLAIPGWTSYVVTLFFIVLMQAFMLSLAFIFIVLTARNNTNFIPQRDYHYFILKVQHDFSNL